MHRGSIAARNGARGDFAGAAFGRALPRMRVSWRPQWTAATPPSSRSRCGAGSRRAHRPGRPRTAVAVTAAVIALAVLGPSRTARGREVVGWINVGALMLMTAWTVAQLEFTVR